MMQSMRFSWRMLIFAVNRMNVSQTRNSSLGSPGEDHAGALTNELSRGAPDVTQEIVLVEYTTSVAG